MIMFIYRAMIGFSFRVGIRLFFGVRIAVSC